MSQGRVMDAPQSSAYVTAQPRSRAGCLQPRPASNGIAGRHAALRGRPTGCPVSRCSVSEIQVANFKSRISSRSRSPHRSFQNNRVDAQAPALSRFSAANGSHPNGKINRKSSRCALPRAPHAAKSPQAKIAHVHLSTLSERLEWINHALTGSPTSSGELRTMYCATSMFTASIATLSCR